MQKRHFPPAQLDLRQAGAMVETGAPAMAAE